MSNHKAPKRSLFAILFGLIFTLVGGLFLFLVVREYIATIDTYTWKQVPARITSVEIDFPKKAPRNTDANVFELLTDYKYSYDNVQRRGTRFRRNPYSSSSYEALADRKWQIVRDEWDRAYVDPDNPDQAILERDSLWFGLLILFPIPFVVVGTTAIAAGLGFFANTDWKPKSPHTNGGKKSILALMLFGGVFLATGVVLTITLCVLPWQRGRAAQGWKKVTCQVIWSRVLVHQDDEGDTYSPDIFYSYEYEGESYRSNRYSFDIGSSSGRSAKQRVVDQYPAGQQTECFVDPYRPWHAVIEPDRSIGFLWIIGLIFSAVGATVLKAGIGQFFRNR